MSVPPEAGQGMWRRVPVLPRFMVMFRGLPAQLGPSVGCFHRPLARFLDLVVIVQCDLQAYWVMVRRSVIFSDGGPCRSPANRVSAATSARPIRVAMRWAARSPCGLAVWSEISTELGTEALSGCQEPTGGRASVKAMCAPTRTQAV